MIARMLRIFKICLLISVIFGLLCAETGSENSLSADLRFDSPATPSLQVLDLQPTADVFTEPYIVMLNDQYAPGETISFNLKINDQKLKIEKAAVIAFDKKYELQEFFDQQWHVLIPLSRDVLPGDYVIKLFLNIQGSANISEKIPLNIDYRLSDIRLVGLNTVSENEVHEVLTIAPGEFYSSLRAEVGRQKIMDLSYFEKTTYTKSNSGNAAVLTYFVSENPVIKSIDLSGSIEFSKEELLQNFSTKPGEVLSYKKLQKDILRLENFYKDKDYTFSKVIAVDEPTSANNYVLTFRVNEGRLKNIAVTGNTVTQEYVIRREMEMRPGEVFSASTLREDLRKIYNLNYFQTVDPEVFFNENTNDVDVTVNVKEKKTSQVSMGGGYGQLQGWFGFADVLLDNIYGTAQSVLLKAQFGQKLTSYQMRYYNPWMWSNRTSFTGKLWSTYGYNYLTGERELRNGWSTAIGFQRSLHITETYSFKYEDVFNTDDRSKNYLDRALGYSIAYDSRDQWMNPTSGSYDIFSMEHSSSFLGGTIDASRYSVQANRFYSLAEKQVLALRGVYNYAIGDIFATEQYYIGGTSGDNIRGYGDIVAKGLQRAFFNFEYRYIFSDMFVGLLFYDIGQAINQVYDPNDDDDNFENHHGWASSMGFGLRIITPIGPIRLDYGWPQYKEFSDGFMVFNIGNTF
jgi:outer membrane protein insertion porin family